MSGAKHDERNLKDELLIENSRQFVEVLKKNGVRYDFRETEGNQSWRRGAGIWRTLRPCCSATSVDRLN
ncbi:MAG: hypothetical protein DME22_15975 [Verrucomicrobia bacterium]|nr:MAG: hypothetical protein DME22_15975 [Verrucomicrobiota bacterium]PYJ98704.1 MAG: hypothetical protein DME23_11375 [Verrucomicrobiota bacterium]